MSSSSPRSSPWPAQTPLPTLPPFPDCESCKLLEVERRDNVAKYPRQTIADQSSIDAAKQQCQNTDNAILSCWPTSDSQLFQNDFTQFVWNSNQPSFAQFDLVDIWLIRADTAEVVQSFPNTPNPFGRAGWISVQAGDAWWGAQGASWPGTNVPFPLYFVIVQSGQSMESGDPQATFTAIQTTWPNSILAAMSSTAAAAASSSAAALSSARSGSGTPSGSGAGSHGTGSAGLQNGSGTSAPLAHWAIAVITILGFFALIAFAMLSYLIASHVRRRRDDRSSSRRGSLGSQQPIMTQSAEGGLPSPPPLAGFAVAGPAGSFRGTVPGRASTVSPDGASTHSETPFSTSDAAVMAEAFRKALRKPEFSEGPVEEAEGGEPPEILNRELAEEGRGIRSVGSSRGVRVEALNEEDSAV